MKEIKLTRGESALINDEDFEWINSYNWALHPQGNGYAVRKGSKAKGEPRTVNMHRMIMQSKPGEHVDHINLNSLDNRKENLRIANIQTNAFNRRKPRVEATSQYKGVLKRKGDPGWEARLKYNDKAIHLGTFRQEEVAAAAYNYAAVLMFGVYARENAGIAPAPNWLKEQVYQKCLQMVLKRKWRPETGAFLFCE